MTLYHYTCDHGRAGILKTGTVLTIAEINPRAMPALEQRGFPDLYGHISWFTDLLNPDPYQVGLTARWIGCNRLAYRFRVIDATPLQAWVGSEQRKLAPRWYVDLLEGIDEALPMHWYIATDPVKVVQDP